jgi:hypothetical protein
MSIGKRIRKALKWAVILILAIFAGTVAFAYLYVTDGDKLAVLIKHRAVRLLPGTMLGLAKVQLRPFVGDITFQHVSFQQRVDSQILETAHIPWLRIRHDAWASFHGRFIPTEVDVAQPTLRIKRRKDGTWNLQGLLAHPWPDKPLPVRPVVMIKGGIVELLTEGEDTTPAKVLRDVVVTIEPTSSGTWHFDGSAQGDAFDRIVLEGELDGKTGRLSLTKGDLSRLAISKTLLRRLPPEVRDPIMRYGLSSGEVDLTIKHLVHNPAEQPALHYEVGLDLRNGEWNCHELPFALNNVEVAATVRDGVVSLQRANGINGKTRVRAWGRLDANGPAPGSFELDVNVLELELDHRLRQGTPPRFAKLWDEFQPRGWVNVGIHLARASATQDLDWGVTIDCKDVAMQYFLFPYPLEHVQGTLDWQGSRIGVDMRAIVGNKPLTAKGTIVNPGPRTGEAHLDFNVGSMPIDETLMGALPPNVYEIVRHFHPSGSTRARAHLHRIPPVIDPGPEGKGRIDLTVETDLNEGCAMKWDGMPYPISNLTGHLSISANKWIFSNMQGENGPARISGKGHVDQKLPGKYAVDLELTADDLWFDSQLRMALPDAWKATWATLDPSGSSQVVAKIAVGPGMPDKYHFEITPKPKTRIQLELTPAPGTPVVGSGGTIKLPPMEDVRGRFVFDNGWVTMEGVKFSFHDAPVEFRTGSVRLEPTTSAFNLAVQDLVVSNLRLDPDLRRVMPPLMQEFSRRLDDGRTFRAHAGSLGISWEGKLGQPAFVKWSDTIVVFNGNTLQVGLPMGQIHGQAERVMGSSDGRELNVEGILRLESIDLLGQQISKVSTPVRIGNGWADLPDIQGNLLGGKLYGRVRISLDATPKYEAAVNLQKADLAEYTKTVIGRQELRGLVSARAKFSGQGNDLHTLSGDGTASIEEGDLGKLPWVVRLLKVLNLAPLSKTAFDSASVDFRIEEGVANLKPIKLTGDAVSLRGQGTVDPLGDLDVHLSVSYGRDDRLHVPILTDLAREAGGRLVAIQLKGPVANPKPKAEFLPFAAKRWEELKERRTARAGGVIR